MELLQSTNHQFPAIVIPFHRAFNPRTRIGLCSRRGRRMKTRVGVVFNSQVTETQHFKSSFDEYLKDMESVTKTRRERNKHSKMEDLVEAMDSIHTVKLNRKLNQNKESGTKDQTGSSQVTSQRGFKRLDRAELNGTGFSVNLRLKEDKSKGSGLINNQAGLARIKVNKSQTGSIPDRFDSSDFSQDGVQNGRPISRMEMEDRIQKLAKCLNGAGIDIPEWMFSKMMRSAQIRFCDHSIMRVLQILGKLGNWRRVLQVIEWLQMRERFKSHKLRHVYTAALDALGKAKRPVEALNVFHTMQQQKSTYPDVVAYHCIAVTLGQAGHMKELFDVMDSMRSVPKNFKVAALEKMDPRLDPDIVVYNSVLNACIRRKQWEGAFWVLQQLKQAALKPTSTTYGLVMEVMLACGKYNLVHDFFKKVQKSSIPNALTYRVVVNALWKEGRTHEAIGAVQDMERRGIVGSASLYYDVARCLCSAGRCEEALKQVNKICKVASKPLVVTYTGLIQSCLDAGRVEDGAYMFNHMHQYCSPNLITCNVMLKAYLEHGMLNEATQLFEKMLLKDGRIRGGIKGKDGVTPDIYTFNTMLEALIAHEKWDDFESAYEQMLDHGHHFNTKRHMWMVIKASSAGKVGSVETTWKQLMQEDRIPPPALVKERFLVKLKNSDLMGALSTLNSHPSTHQQSFSKEAWLELLQLSIPHTGTALIHHLSLYLNTYLSTADSPNLLHSNLFYSCNQILRDADHVALTNPTERPLGASSSRTSTDLC